MSEKLFDWKDKATYEWKKSFGVGEKVLKEPEKVEKKEAIKENLFKSWKDKKQRREER